MTERIIDVWVHCPDEAVAERIAEQLLAKRLVATANLYPPVESRYRWQGEIQRRSEIPLRLRTLARHFEQVEEVVSALHPYETPGIVALSVEKASTRYLDWIRAETVSLGRSPRSGV